MFTLLNMIAFCSSAVQSSFSDSNPSTTPRQFVSNTHAVVPHICHCVTLKARSCFERYSESQNLERRGKGGGLTVLEADEEGNGFF